MPDTRELLGMLTPHGIRMDGAHGGIPRLTPQDVAAAMGMGEIPEEQGHLLLVKYCGDNTPIHKLWASWFMRVMEKKQFEGWKSDKPGRFEAMSRFTLNETLSDNLCPVCCGRATVWAGNLEQSCKRCEGSGKSHQTPRMAAVALGVALSAFQKTWVPRFAWCRSELMIWEANAIAGVSRALK